MAHPFTKEDHRKILVIGTGVGLDAIALAKLTGAKVTATDISKQALVVAQLNAKIHEMENKVKYIQSDLLDSVTTQFDLIIFNAPRAVTHEIFKEAGVPNEKALKAIETLQDSPNYLFDMHGTLFKKLMKDLPEHTTKDGKLLIMTDEHIGVHVPSNYGIKPLSDPLRWDIDNSDDHNFRIFEIDPNQ